MVTAVVALSQPTGRAWNECRSSDRQSADADDPRPGTGRDLRTPSHRLAYGYYGLVPLAQNPRMWMPDLETAAAGVATAVWGDAVPILMGLSAARIHGALPRALGEAMVAVPSIHGPISLTDRNATIRFITRNVEALDAIRVGTELGPALATTPAQTALDLARDPRLLEKPEDIAVRSEERRVGKEGRWRRRGEQ